MKIGISVATLFIPLIGIIMGIIYLKDSNPEKKSVGRLWLWIGAGMSVLICILALMSGGGSF